MKMSIKTKPFYTLKCDRCGTLPQTHGEPRYWMQKELLYDIFPEWEKINGKDCCPDCWRWNEDETELIVR